MKYGGIKVVQVSVIIPVYNAARFIEKTVESVLEQTYEDYEIILIDDKSADDSYEIIKRLQKRDGRIRVFQNSCNSGVSYTRNYGVDIANGEWIAFLDSDDYWEKTKLDKQMRIHLENPEIVLSYTGSSFIGEDGEKYEYVMHVNENVTFKELLHKNVISCSSVIVRKDVIKKYAMKSDDMHEDYTAWLNILREYPFAYGIDEPLLVYRFVKNSKSSSRIKSAKMIFNSYRAVGYNWLVSLVYTFWYAVYSISYRSKIH